MKNYINGLLALGVVVVSCTNNPTGNQKLTGIDTIQISKDVEILASDQFLGRKPFTEGERKTLDFLETSFKTIGLSPGNGDSYFQAVPLVEIDPYPDEKLSINGPNGRIELNRGSEFVAWSEIVAEKASIDASELVFAGFGIVAPEYNWNDYEGLDVKGKTVLVLVNDPGFGSKDSTFFKGQTMTYYGRWTYKYEEAARQGAAGLLIIHDTAPAGYPWMVVRNSWTGAQLYLEKDPDQYLPAVQGWITRDAAIKIFESSPVDMKNFLERSRTPGFKPVALELSASLEINSKIKRNMSQNVIGKIEGKKNADEVIIYTAHWDHLGVGPVIDGDSIYNGARDNATGVAALMEIAREFKRDNPNPDRTVVFLSVTAEEQGLLGSKYYAEHPIYPPNNTIAVLNMDAISTVGFSKDLTVIGYGQSELEDLAEEIAKKQDRYIQPNPEPEKGYFFRSDHFEFAKIGIPAFYAEGGSVAVVGGEERATKVNDAYREHAYHQPADEYTLANSDWQFGTILQDTELFYLLGKKLANSELRPKWKSGSEFKSIREGN
ncbi:MAG: M28 family metallopeptidase [Bacteroidota bacterium]